MSKKRKGQEKERPSRGRGQKSISTVTMRCGCGFSTSDIHDWYEHRKEGCKKDLYNRRR